jgi:hypothetical protein
VHESHLPTTWPWLFKRNCRKKLSILAVFLHCLNFLFVFFTFLFKILKFLLFFFSSVQISNWTGSPATPRLHFLTQRLVATAGTSPWSAWLLVAWPGLVEVEVENFENLTSEEKLWNWFRRINVLSWEKQKNWVLKSCCLFYFKNIFIVEMAQTIGLMNIWFRKLVEMFPKNWMSPAWRSFWRSHEVRDFSEASQKSWREALQKSWRSSVWGEGKCTLPSLLTLPSFLHSFQ